MNNQPLPSKLHTRRKLSWIGLVVALICGASALYWHFLYCDELGCITNEIMILFSAILGVPALLLAAAGFVTTSKAYHNNQNHSLPSMVIGLLISVISSYFLILSGHRVLEIITNNYQSGYTVIDGSVIFFGILVLGEILLLTLGLRIIYKGFVKRGQTR